MLPGESAKVIRVAGGDDAAAEPDRGGDNQGVDHVAGIQVIAVTQAASLARRRLADRDWAYTAAQDPVDR